jgi:HD-like signal output (HDOD) protein/CheY-like chemotaxis protein
VKRVLFVDDEPNVLEGLRGVLRKQRKVWEMTFVASGGEALAVLAASPQDVIVSDMRMPGMDGVSLLGRVQAEHPATARLVLSGQTEPDAARRVVHVAHQFLSKPCDGHLLRQAIERVCTLPDLLASAGGRTTPLALREAAGAVAQLPLDPALRARLLDPAATVEEMTAAVERDPGMAAKLLQLASSALFGAPHPVADLGAAVGALGGETIRQLVRAPESEQAVAVALGPLSDRAVRAAGLVRRLLGDHPQAPLAVSACLLQDVGLLVLATRLPDLLAEVNAAATRAGRPSWQVERQLLGVTHADIGAYLLGLWGLPPALVEAVAAHHGEGGGGEVTSAVRTASAMAVAA